MTLGLEERFKLYQKIYKKDKQLEAIGLNQDCWLWSEASELFEDELLVATGLELNEEEKEHLLEYLYEVTEDFLKDGESIIMFDENNDFTTKENMGTTLKLRNMHDLVKFVKEMYKKS